MALQALLLIAGGLILGWLARMIEDGEARIEK
jgi:hypothetical protein